MSKSKRNKRIEKSYELLEPLTSMEPLVADLLNSQIKHCPKCNSVCFTLENACLSSSVPCPECGISFCPTCNSEISYKEPEGPKPRMREGYCNCPGFGWLGVEYDK
jgi:hypothetical protein